MSNEKTYEMMWDCQFCAAKKLLGKTHRHCPNCGAPQNPDGRYFPPESEKVAVEDHEYVGADLLCPACQVANGRKANNCGNCGSPLQGGRAAATQQEQVIPDGGVPVAPSPTQAKPSKGTSKLLIGCVVAAVLFVILAVIAFLVINSLWTKEAGFEVVGHSWTHEIPVERFQHKSESGPCSKMPSGATDVKRTPQPPVCDTRKVDQGDGTYKEKRECKDQEDKCSYSVGKWSVVRSEKASGNSVNDTLQWPTVNLGRTGDCEGCEREGERESAYVVKLKDSAAGKEHSCTFSDTTKWKSFEAGSTWMGSVSVMSGGLQCDSLKRAK